MRSLLDHQADGIEYTLHSHGIEASVVGGNISPRLIQFHIKLGTGVKFNRVVALADEIALALGVGHCRISRDGYFVRAEVPRPDPQAVKLFPLMRNLPGTIPFNSPILGLDETGVPLLLRLNSPDVAHILVSGTTGSGKTILARSMIASLALQNPPEQLRLLLIDPKGRGYRDFNGLPHLVCPVVTDPLDGLHRLKWAVRHMEKRDEKGISSPLLVIFIDELADLIMVGGKEMEMQIARLTQRGREAGIHVVGCTQKPSANVIGGIAKSNFPTRLVGRVVSPEDARVASGVAGSGAEKLLGRGDFLLFTNGEVNRVQGAFISQEEMLQTVEHLIQQYPEEVRQAAGQISQTMTYRHQETTPRPEPARDTGVSAGARAISRRETRADYAADYEDAFELEEDDPIGPIPPRAVSPSLRAMSGGRGGGAASRGVRAIRPEPDEGVAERLEAYYRTIQQRRQQAELDRTKAAKKESLYRPPATRGGPERKAPAYAQDVWAQGNEALPDAFGDDFEDDDFEELAAERPAARPAPTRLSQAAGRRKPAPDPAPRLRRHNPSFRIGS
jgi:S-DNA-T family DNA segregation ATPase FtsK/SpoIIIE